MSLWVVRAGGHGEQEQFAIDNNLVVIGWDEVSNLNDVTSRDQLTGVVHHTYPDEGEKKLRNSIAQLWMMRERIKTGDLVVLPLKTKSAIAIGRVTGGYEYNATAPWHCHHRRPVEWLKIDIPRSTFDQDLLYSFGGAMTVFQVSRNNAKERVEAFLRGEEPKSQAPAVGGDDEGATERIGDLSEFAADQIRDILQRKFKGHDLARLVGEILRAQGYKVWVAPPGADGGVDILAGSGPMGFESPKIAVQVKSQDSPIDVTVLRELQGVMSGFGADQALLVAWGGFKSSVDKEARQLFFQIRLWDAGDVVQQLQGVYERLSDETQADIPLKRIWTVVQED